MIVQIIAWLRDRMILVKVFCMAVLALLIVGDLFVPRPHPHFLGDIIPGFWAAFGFMACTVIIVGSKWLGTAFLFRPDSYYETDEEKEADKQNETATKTETETSLSQQKNQSTGEMT